MCIRVCRKANKITRKVDREVDKGKIIIHHNESDREKEKVSDPIGMARLRRSIPENEEQEKRRQK